MLVLEEEHSISDNTHLVPCGSESLLPVTWGWVGMLGIKVGAHHPHVSYVVTLAMAKWRRGFSRLGAHSSGPDNLQV